MICGTEQNKTVQSFSLHQRRNIRGATLFLMTSEKEEVHFSIVFIFVCILRVYSDVYKLIPMILILLESGTTTV